MEVRALLVLIAGTSSPTTSSESCSPSLGIAVDYIRVDGAKANRRVERKLALIAEGAKAAWPEFPRHLPDLEFPSKALV